jgi:DNA-binding response OmpR family regulator
MKNTKETKKIVLVEDDPDVCLILEQLLSDAGYEVTALNDGRQILEIEFDAPGLFILDITLPDIDGIALCKFLKLQKRFKYVPILMLSANRQLKHKALLAGANSFLEKPFKIERLLWEVDQSLREEKLISYL